MGKIRVILADDYIPYRWSVLAELSGNPSIEIVEEASDGEEAVRKALEHSPDVVLLDLHMPKFDGHEATRQILSEMPNIKIIINTISDNESDLEMALKAGARGYLVKEGGLEQIADAISYVHQGGILISPSFAPRLGDDFISNPEQESGSEVQSWEAMTDDDVKVSTLIADIILHFTCRTIRNVEAAWLAEW
jgi:DNA-binding NarL/FixJ family response regulator